MTQKETIIQTLKMFEQQDYKRGGVSIAPEMYNAIADKLCNSLLKTGYEYDQIQRYTMNHKSTVRRSTVVVTIEIPIVITEDHPEEDTNYSGRLDWEFQDEDKFKSELNDNIVKQIIEYKL